MPSTIRTTPRKYSDAPTMEKVEAMSAWLRDHKARDLTTIDLAGRCAFTEAMIVATATSVRHGQSLADGISALCAEKKYEYLRVDGYNVGTWILVDCNDVVVHIFQAEAREHYGLESLWSVPTSLEIQHRRNAQAEAAQQEQPANPTEEQS